MIIQTMGCSCCLYLKLANYHYLGYSKKAVVAKPLSFQNSKPAAELLKVGLEMLHKAARIWLYI